jgi:stage IV sporulation protein FB
LGNFYGVDIYLNYFFLGLLALFFVAGVLVKGLLAFAIVLAHEFAHVATARRLGVPAGEVELLPFGGVSRIGGDLVMDPRREICVAAAGPASNLAMILLAVAGKNYGLWHDDLGPFFLQCNILIALFNMLPALPLDGGRVYRAYLARRMGIREATHRAAAAGQFWAMVIATLGALGIIFEIAGLDILITAMFLFYAASRERGQAAYLFVRHLMHKKEELARAGVLPAEHLVAVESTPLGDIVKPFVPQKFHLVLVLDRSYRYMGVVTEAEILDRLLEGGADLTVGSLTGK